MIESVHSIDTWTNNENENAFLTKCDTETYFTWEQSHHNILASHFSQDDSQSRAVIRSHFCNSQSMNRELAPEWEEGRGRLVAETSYEIE